MENTRYGSMVRKRFLPSVRYAIVKSLQVDGFDDHCFTVDQEQCILREGRYGGEEKNEQQPGKESHRRKASFQVKKNQWFQGYQGHTLPVPGIPYLCTAKSLTCPSCPIVRFPPAIWVRDRRMSNTMPGSISVGSPGPTDRRNRSASIRLLGLRPAGCPEETEFRELQSIAAKNQVKSL